MLLPPFPFKIKIETQEKIGKLSRIAVNYMRRKVSGSLEICHGLLQTDSSKSVPVALQFANMLHAVIQSLLCF